MGGQVDPNVPTPARIYDYWLGGKDNFDADRRHAEQLKKENPRLPLMAQQNRLWLIRAVRHAVRIGSVCQIIDMGCGLPTSGVGFPNVHEVAQRVAPDVRVVYLDNDPIVQSHGRALLASQGNTDFYPADLRYLGDFRSSMGVWGLDPSKPVLVILAAVLHFFRDRGGSDPYGIVREIMDAVEVGSYLAITHGEEAEELRQVAATYSAADSQLRTKGQVEKFFSGMDMVDPGVVRVHKWRPDEDVSAFLDDVPVLGGLARKP